MAGTILLWQMTCSNWLWQEGCKVRMVRHRQKHSVLSNLTVHCSLWVSSQSTSTSPTLLMKRLECVFSLELVLFCNYISALFLCLPSNKWGQRHYILGLSFCLFERTFSGLPSLSLLFLLINGIVDSCGRYECLEYLISCGLRVP